MFLDQTHLFVAVVDTDIVTAAQEAITTVTSESASLFDVDVYVQAIIEYGFRVLLAIILFIIGRIAIHWILRLLRFHLKKANTDVGLKQFIESFARGALFVLLIFIIATNVGFSASSAAALLASAGLAIGMALQGSLSNFAGGILILMLKPFQVGDYIISSASGMEGEVTEIRVFCTRLRTNDNKVVIVPNGALSNSSITNLTLLSTRRIDLELALSNKIDYKKAKQSIENVFQTNEKILTQQPIQVFVSEVGETSVTITMRVWVETPFYEIVKGEVYEEIKTLLDTKELQIES